MSFVPATLFCEVPLIDDCNRHQFPWGGRQGLQITSAHTHTQRGQEDNGGADKRLWRRRIPSRRGKRKKEALRALYSFVTQTLSLFRISTRFNRKQVVTFWHFLVIQNPNPLKDQPVHSKNKTKQQKKLLYNLKGLLFRFAWLEAKELIAARMGVPACPLLVIGRGSVVRLRLCKARASWKGVSYIFH